jgi:hypothetical protein
MDRPHQQLSCRQPAKSGRGSAHPDSNPRACRATIKTTKSVPAMTALGYAGVLAGPAAIGFVAQATSLSVAS